MNEEGVQRDLGRLDAQVSQLILNVAALTVEQAKTNQVLSEAKGGWRTLLWIGGAGGLVGAMITKMLPFLSSGPQHP